MICYEMIGYFTDAARLAELPRRALAKLYPSTGNFIMVVGKTGQEAFTQRVHNSMQPHAGSLDVQRINLPDPHGLGRPFRPPQLLAHTATTAVMINDTSFLRNPNYHQNHRHHRHAGLHKHGRSRPRRVRGADPAVNREQ